MPVLERIDLFQKNEATNTDKQYAIQLEESAGAFSVTGFNGRRGASLTPRPQKDCPTDYDGAKKFYDNFVASQMKKGYTPDASGVAYLGSELAGRDTGMRPQLLNEIDEAAARELINDDAWVMLEKKDGERRMVRKRGDAITGANRRGLEVPLPEPLVEALQRLSYDFTIDCEIIGSKIFVFDLMDVDGDDFRAQGFVDRHTAAAGVAVDAQCPEFIDFVECWTTTADKQAAYERLKAFAEGVVFKHAVAVYNENRPSSGGNALKRKFWESVSAIVTGINAKSSIALALLDAEGNAIAVGNVTVKANQDTPEIGNVVEVKYLYMTGPNGALYQPELIAVRHDIERDECRLAQVKYKSEAA